MTQAVEDWYKGLFNGTFLLTVSIVNLISIPYVQYNEQIRDLEGLKINLTTQICINVLY